MGKIPDEFIAEMRAFPIEELAAQQFDLMPMGNILQTKCIHEGDNSPSLTFFTQTNTFYCFGCGAGKRPKTEGSDPISFLMWVDNCSFSEALQKIASLKGVEVPRQGLTKEEKQRAEMVAQTTEYNRHYWAALQEEPRYLEYLDDRGITLEEVNKWRIGMVPADDQSKFKTTLVFALMNDWGQTVGFSHRNMSDTFEDLNIELPKYVNSSKSPIFDKGRILYGLNFVKKLIREKGYVIVGEGFGDAILGQRMGLPFVSVMGTSMTDAHIQTLKSYTDTVILWMDGDHGGIQATLRHAKALQKEGFLVKVINYQGKDPDDLFLHGLAGGDLKSAKLYAEALVRDTPVLASQFEVNQVLNVYKTQVTELALQTLKKIEPLLGDMEDGAEKAFVKKRVADELELKSHDLWGD